MLVLQQRLQGLVLRQAVNDFCVPLGRICLAQFPGLSVSEAWMDFLARICLKGGCFCQLPQVSSAVVAATDLMADSRLAI